MDEKSKKKYLDYIRDGLSKGYTEDQLREILEQNRIPHNIVEELFFIINEENPNFKQLPQKEFEPEMVKGKIPFQQKPKETFENKFKEEKDHSRLYSLLIIFLGITIMIGVYIIRIFFSDISTKPVSPIFGIIKALWPLIFPISANILNFFMFRKRFLVGLIISVIFLALLVGLVILMAFMGI